MFGVNENNLLNLRFMPFYWARTQETQCISQQRTHRATHHMSHASYERHRTAASCSVCVRVCLLYHMRTCEHSRKSSDQISVLSSEWKVFFLQFCLQNIQKLLFFCVYMHCPISLYSYIWCMRVVVSNSIRKKIRKNRSMCICLFQEEWRKRTEFSICNDIWNLQIFLQS